MERKTESSVERAPSLDHDGRAAYRATSNDRNPSTAVILAVGEVTDADPLGEGPVLYDVVDPDALDRLFDGYHDGSARSVGRVTFELRGCRVEVRSDDEVVVYEPAETPTESSSSATGPA